MTAMAWEAFVREYGWRARKDHLAHVLGVDEAAILKARHAGCRRLARAKRFAELFALRHGRPPEEADWPKPRRAGGQNYEWTTPERALLASLVGHMGKAEIAQVLTERLRRVTGDATAVRNPVSVQIAVSALGLQFSDVLNGITLREAAAEISGSWHALYHEIQDGRLTARRVGRLLVLDRAEFERWKATRVLPPKGYVRLASIRPALGMSSDAKLPEYASLGYIPTAVRCNPYGVGTGNTKNGTWYIDRKVARQLVADRRAGRPMPWFGKPSPCNLRATWKKLETRWHPDACEDCRGIWGPAGRPRTCDDFTRRYPPLTHGAKRHLSRPWSWGLTIAQVAADTHRSESAVRRAIDLGLLEAQRGPRGTLYVTRTNATSWKARRCPTGKTPHSWMSIASACKAYGFTRHELQQHIAAGALREKVGTTGAMRDVRYVLRHQVGRLRERLGYSLEAAAVSVGVSVPRMRVLLRGLEWRPAPLIPKYVVDAAKKRKYSTPGYTLAEAARRLKKSPGWIEQQVRSGAVRVLRARWEPSRRYVSAPIFAQLERLAHAPQGPRPVKLTADWMTVSFAAHHAGVTAATVIRWAEAGEVRTRESSIGRRYHRRSVEARARRYWGEEARWKRVERRPSWLTDRTAA